MRIPPSPTVDRVARAIWASDGLGREDGWELTANRDVYWRRARAAIDAYLAPPDRAPGPLALDPYSPLTATTWPA